jgi:hypothetical protein
MLSPDPVKKAGQDSWPSGKCLNSPRMLYCSAEDDPAKARSKRIVGRHALQNCGTSSRSRSPSDFKFDEAEVDRYSVVNFPHYCVIRFPESFYKALSINASDLIQANG